MQFNLVV